LARILSLKPEDENILHPEAVRWLKARITEIQFEVPLEELSDDDLNTFLSDDEKLECQTPRISPRGVSANSPRVSAKYCPHPGGFLDILHGSHLLCNSVFAVRA